MTSSLRLRAAALFVSFACTALPASAFAETPQQMFDRSLAGTLATLPLQTHVDVTFTTTKSSFKKGVKPTKVTVKALSTSRELAHVGTRRDMEGRIAVQSVSTDAAGVTPFPKSLKDPGSIQWKLVDKTLYVRVERLAPEMMALLPSGNFSSIVGQWISVDATEFMDEAGDALGVGSWQSVLLNGKIGSGVTLKASPFRVVGAKKMTVNGVQMLAMDLRLTPKMIAEIEKAERQTWKSFSKDQAGRESLKQARDSWATKRAMLQGLRMRAIVDPSGKSLKRIEVGLSQTEPDKDCSYDFNKHRFVCRVVGRSVATLAAGVSFLKDDGATIDVPAGAMTAQELMNKLREPDPADITPGMGNDGVATGTVTSTEISP